MKKNLLTLADPPEELSWADISRDLTHFYSNQRWEPVVGDPFIHYEEPEGLFYLYGTTRKNSVNNDIYDNFEIYSSTDMKIWSKVADAFDPVVRENSWMDQALHNNARFWAPEMYKIGSYYYLYYTAANRQGNLRCSVAWAKSPAGPFYTDFREEFKDEIARLDPHPKNPDGSDNPDLYNGMFALLRTTNMDLPDDNDWAAIDATMFRDEDGEFYVYIARDQQPHPNDPDGDLRKSTIWGCHMLNPFIKDPNSKFRQLTDVGRSYLGGPIDQLWEKKDGNWNEGPFVIKREGNYYLTYSANSFAGKYYSIGHAISDHPLEGFVKPAENALIMGLGDGTAADWNYYSGTGHHMFLDVASQKYAVYHKHRALGDDKRVVCVDTYGFREDNSMYINGPTITAQPLPDVVTGYKNLFIAAQVEVDYLTDNELKFLKDGSVGLQKYTVMYETHFRSGETVIRITLPERSVIHAVILYNSALYSSKLSKIDKIEFDDLYYIEDIELQNEMTGENEGTPYLVAGSNLNALLEEDIEATTIKITIHSETPFNLSEIVIMGK